MQARQGYTSCDAGMVVVSCQKQCPKNTEEGGVDLQVKDTGAMRLMHTRGRGWLVVMAHHEKVTGFKTNGIMCDGIEQITLGQSIRISLQLRGSPMLGI